MTKQQAQDGPEKDAAELADEILPQGEDRAEQTASGDAGGEPAPEAEKDPLAERDEYLARWQRAQADYQNLKRRSHADVENRLRRTMEPLLRNLLLVLDHLDMALMSPAESPDAKNLSMGVDLVRRQMITALEESEVEPIADGGTFNPEQHQAVARVEDSDAEPNAVLETLRRGYTWRDRVLRHAEVRVAAEPSDAEAKAPGDVPQAE